MNYRIAFFVAIAGMCFHGQLRAQVSVVADDFESGIFSADWDAIEGTGLSIINTPGDGSGGTDYYARIEGVGSGQGGLGVSLTGLDTNSPFATDFNATFDFRVDSTTDRQFNLQLSGRSSNPSTTSASLNLRYQGSEWAAFNGSSWQVIGGLSPILPGEWNTLSISGSNWGSGGVGTATYDLSLTDHLSSNSTQTGIQIFQSDNVDTAGALSLNFNDTFGSNPGYDLDNVSIMASPAPPISTTEVITPINPVAYSGIYPHTAVTNTHNEAAVGALIKRDGKVWYVTYGPHVTAGGSDELYSVDLNNLTHTTYKEYPGNTDANRYTDNHLGIDVIGAAYIEHATGTIRYLPVTSPNSGDLVGRITGTSAHLTDPNKLYYMTMEEALYEVDFSDLDNPVITTLRADGNHDSQGGIQKNLPGIHGKGLFTGQGRIFFTNNGAGGGAGGGLVEWDGNGDPEDLASWTIADDTAQYTEVTSRQGPVDMDPSSTDAIWATGWDDESLFINTRDASTGQWTKYRLPKSSYTHGHPNGWYTEWPRIRDVGLEGGYLMSHHGMMFLVPEGFETGNYGGLKPIASHHKMIVDYIEDGDQIIFAGNDSSKQLGNNILPRANSNIMFLDKTEVPNYGGNPKGYGGVWVNDSVTANEASDAFLIDGFRDRVVHFKNSNANSVNFTIEVDQNGTGNWTTHTVVSVDGTLNGNGYDHYLLPADLSAEWVRFKTDTNVSSASAYLHMGNGAKAANTTQMASLADPSSPTARSQGILRSTGSTSFELEFAADRLDAAGNIVGTGYYVAQLNPTTAALELIAVNDPSAEAAVRSSAATTQDYGVDNASAYVEEGGTRFRLPKGHSAFDTATASGWRRGEREVVTERDLLNVHGTIYEVPHSFTGGGIRRLVPITTHNRDIFDFMSWRGMMVLSGVEEGSTEDGHYVQSDDGEVGLWFGNVDDLWTFGAPVGVGGPWSDTAVTANDESDPYLMAGYAHKQLEISHENASPVEFTVEVDFLGTNEWHIYDTFTVAPGETLLHTFERGYSAHWVRLVSDTSTNATATFTYSEFIPLLGDYDLDGDVDQADYQVWSNSYGSTQDLSADGNGDGVVNAADFTIWRDALAASQSTSLALASINAIPEPTSLVLLAFGASFASVNPRK